MGEAPRTERNAGAERKYSAGYAGEESEGGGGEGGEERMGENNRGIKLDTAAE